MGTDVEHVKRCLNQSLQILDAFKWLIDSYVLDFFVEDHWDNLPESWRVCFSSMDPEDLGKIIYNGSTKTLLPLSFLALLKSVNLLSVPRQPKVDKDDRAQVHNSETTAVDPDKEYGCGDHPKLRNLFLKHVKLKKRHEISLMAETVQKVAATSCCSSVVDFGSGLGHLVRVLAYKCDMHAAGIEQQTRLTAQARKLDLELEYTASKHLPVQKIGQLRRPMHLNITLLSENQLKDTGLSGHMEEYGLVGLHPCGDLGPFLLRHFAECPRVRFICLAGCCYMKLSCSEDATRGYPMSDYVLSLDTHSLSYASREIACHAIETYCDRLRVGCYEDLKVHAYRAALERVLVGADAGLRHAPVRSIKHTPGLTFVRYCEMALERLDVDIPPGALDSARTALDLSRWKRVVIFYTLRLSLAPLIETVVLLDRLLYLLEHGLSCRVQPVFNPTLSPRNHVIIGKRD